MSGVMMEMKMESNDYVKIGRFEISGWKASIVIYAIILAWTALSFYSGTLYTAQ